MQLKDEVLINVFRSGSLESQHTGSVAAVDFDGNLIAYVGDPKRQSYMRSSVKPVQALPTFMDDTCMKRFKFNARERAYLMSSHNAERRHQMVGAKIQEKLGVTNDDMGCGIHPPLHKQTARDMLWNQEPYTPLCNNCSGNHLVMMALTIHHGWDLKNYIDPKHPYQQEVLKWMSLLTGLPKSKIRTGMDNCSVPAYNLTLHQMALIFARLSNPEKLPTLPNPDNLDLEKAATVIRQIIADYWAHPEMIGGEKRICTYLNIVGKGKFFSKAGAEGMQLVGVVDKGVGIALKITDGDAATRAKPSSIIETLFQLGLITDSELKKADKSLYKPNLLNLRGFDAQTIETPFKVKKLKGWNKIFG